MGEVIEATALAGRLEGERARRTVVFTNGCFDLLHYGHVDYLGRARALGDMLVVGVNGDESVRRLKGPSRPIVPERERMAVLAALSAVDYVVRFDEDTPTELITLLKPDIHVKGGDYAPEELPEAAAVGAYGGRVEIVPFLPGRSTSKLIAKIRAAGAGNP